MRLRDSFVHNVLVHPLFFPAEVFARLGFTFPLMVAEALHDATAPAEPEEPEEPAEGDETEAWEVPAQAPHTPASRSLEWRPPAPLPAPEAPAPLAGSAAARMRAARRAG